jgi:DNA-binding CsgD family transcriptional regulator/uncharacterized protein YciI
MTRFVVEMRFSEDSEQLARQRPAHRAYWERLAVGGVLVGGGLFAGEAGGMLLCEVTDEQELRGIIGADPYSVTGLLSAIRIREWHVMVGTENAAGVDEIPELLGLTTVGTAPSATLVRRIENEVRIVRSSFCQGEKPLTAHEHRIAGMMVGGKTNREIAAQFRVSTRAVELHITSMYRKLGINRRAQLAGALPS